MVMNGQVLVCYLLWHGTSWRRSRLECAHSPKIQMLFFAFPSNSVRGGVRCITCVSACGSGEALDARQCQADAAAHLAEGGGDHVPLMTHMLAELGATGSQKGNAARDLRRWMRNELGALSDDQFYWVPVKVQPPHEDAPMQARLPMILPHETFANLYNEGAQVWGECILGMQATGCNPGPCPVSTLGCNPGPCPVSTPHQGPVNLNHVSEFWQKLQHTEWVQTHPAMQDPHLMEVTIPLGFHGDGGAISKHESMIALTWSSVLAKGDPMTCRLMITCIPSAWALDETLDEAMKVIAWSFGALLDGYFPFTDHLGRPWEDTSPRKAIAGRLLANGFRGAWAESRGDWDWHVKCYKLNNWCTKECCFLCGATTLQGPLCYSDFTDKAPWRDTMRTHDAWMNTYA